MLHRTCRISGLIVLAGFVNVVSAQHTGDVWVGRSAANQVAISPRGFVPAMSYHFLSPVSGLLHGWTDDDPGFDHITAADPNNDLLVLQNGAQLWLEIVSLDGALRLIDSAFNILDTPGQTTYLGGYNLHVHNTWHINSDDPAYDPDQCVWHMTVVLRDTGGTSYGASLPHTFSFTNVPVRPPVEPATGDFDGSGGADPADWLALATCYSAPGARPAPSDPATTTCEVTCLNAFDFDNDQDLDLSDVASFQTRPAGR